MREDFKEVITALEDRIKRGYLDSYKYGGYTSRAYISAWSTVLFVYSRMSETDDIQQVMDYINYKYSSAKLDLIPDAEEFGKNIALKYALDLLLELRDRPKEYTSRQIVVTNV